MPSPSTAFEVIENSGRDNLRDTLKFILSRASEVSIAVAFVTQAGLEEIIQPLRQVATEGRVRLLTGLYQYTTEPEALDTLSRVQKETPKRFSVCLSLEPKFHRKVYLVGNNTQTTVIIGSSNLTKEGLQSGGEMNLVLSLPNNSPSIKKLKRAFEDDWQHQAVPLSDEQIGRYKNARPEPLKRKSYPTRQLEKILGKKPKHRGANGETNAEVGFWRDCITGFADERTCQILSETTNWDDKKYWWFSTGGRHSYKIDDRIFLFDFTDDHLRLVEVKGIAHTKVPTLDGRDFVAYRPVRAYAQKLSKSLWTQLRLEGVYKKNAYDRVKVALETAEQLKGLIRASKK